MVPLNKLFTNRTRSVLGNTKPSLLCTALASSGFVVPCTDQVTWLAKSNYLLALTSGKVRIWSGKIQGITGSKLCLSLLEMFHNTEYWKALISHFCSRHAFWDLK